MDSFAVSPYFFAILFFTIAFVYSSVGLGGGSSYTALMAITGISYVVIPTISLTLNLFVTSAGSFNFIRKKPARPALILPFFITSIPMSYLGGSLKLPREIFYWVLLISLIFIAIRIYVWKNTAITINIEKTQKITLSLVAGSILGFVAGTVGIGGGIYLVPLIIILGFGSPREAAACGAVFIWVNSLSGLIARFQYHDFNLTSFLPLIAAVVIGGFLGSFIGSSKLSTQAMEKWLGGIILIAILFLIKKVSIQISRGPRALARGNLLKVYDFTIQKSFFFLKTSLWAGGLVVAMLIFVNGWGVDTCNDLQISTL
jgi:uncharacterized membrane protein YfcA